MAVTQKQIGEKLGVTQQLVALALQGDPRVAEETRNRIVQTAKDLGYHKYSNRHARILISRRHGKRATTGILAVILSPALPSSPATAMPYFREHLNGIEIEAGRRELDILLLPSDGERLPWLIDEGWVDGVICVGSHEHIYGLDKLDAPVVTVGCHFPPISSLIPDDAEGINKVIKHLIELGHRRIAYLGNSHNASGQQRFNSFRQRVAENGLELDDDLIEQVDSFEASTAQGEGLTSLLARDREHQIKQGLTPGRLPSFTAVVCFNDPMAIDTIRKAQELGIKVPEELSITGFDDTSTQYNFQPAVTSVRIPLFEMGRRAVQLICEDLARERTFGPKTPVLDVLLMPKASSVQHEVFPIELVVRESSTVARH
jgi:LacI family transcriptional regulator